MIEDARKQFGSVAKDYLTSASHSNEASLKRCIDVVEPKGGIILDVATGAGHVAYTFAPLVEKVVALDITQEMLDVVEATATERGLTNIEALLADVEEIPFPNDSFDGVACRVAAHHFRDIHQSLREIARVTKPGGWFLLIDIVGIDSEPGQSQLNEIEWLRDPSHVCDYAVPTWESMLAQVGFELELVEESSFPHNVEDWLNRMRVEEPIRSRVRNRIIYAEGTLQDYFRTTGEDETLTFRLHQALILCHKPTAS